MEISDFSLGLISAIILAIITHVIAQYFSRKNLIDQQEHNLKTLKMQLFHEDRKKALIELHEMLKVSYKTFDDFKKAAMTFLDGKQALFLPRKLRSELRGEVLKLNGFLTSRLVEIGFYGEPPDEYLEDYEAEAAAWAEDFPKAALDAEVRERLSGLKSSMRDRIKKYLSEE